MSVTDNRYSTKGVLIKNCFLSARGKDLQSVQPALNLISGKAEVVNTTIAYSYPHYYYNIRRSSGVFVDCSNLALKNCIVWNNRSRQNAQINILNNSSNFKDPLNSQVSVSYSNVEGGRENILIFPDDSAYTKYTDWGYLPNPALIDPNTLLYGPGNIAIDPLFTRAPNDGGDGWLDNTETNWDESANNDYGDLHLRSNNGRFEVKILNADFNFDNHVDLADFALFSESYNRRYLQTQFQPGSLDTDSYVSMYDLTLFIEDFLRWGMPGQWVQDDVTSPCIDAGDPNDLGWQNELWPHGGRINMGAYGGTPQASMSPNQVGMATDLNHDSFIDLVDWSLFSDDWLKMRPLLDSDFDLDSDVDPNDLSTFMDNWLTAATP